MNSSVTSVSPSPPTDTSAVTVSKPSAWRRIKRDKWMLLMMLPGILVFILFKYVPMFGIIVAFQNFKPYLGVLKSPWVGFKHFQTFFAVFQHFNIWSIEPCICISASHYSCINAE